MFGIELYPTPPELIEQMIIDIPPGTILEPSAGTGNIVRVLADRGHEVLACEIDSDLRDYLRSKKCTIIANDFFDVDKSRISHISGIVMNPPFSKAEKHILHAWNIAPPGTVIRALCNRSTVKMEYNKELTRIIEQYGSWEDIGQPFKEAERFTAVEVALIRLEKPGENGSPEYDGFFMEEEIEHQENGLIAYNVIRDIVNRYVEGCRIFEEQISIGVKLNNTLRSFYPTELGLQVIKGNEIVTLNNFKKDLQRSGWKHIFRKLDLNKITTQGLRDDINKFIEKQNHIPFTMRNIYRMLEIVCGTTGARMDKAILEVFNNIIRHSDDNKYNVEGWKTNSHYLLSETFIVPYMAGLSYGGGIDLNYHSRYGEMMEDMVKAITFITGDNYDKFGSLSDTLRYECKIKTDEKTYFFRHDPLAIRLEKEKELNEKGIKYETQISKPKFGEWFDWAYFKVKAFKKGTMHFKFKDPEIWGKFNQRIAKINGYPLFEAKTKHASEKIRHRKQQSQFKDPIILKKDQTVLFEI